MDLGHLERTAAGIRSEIYNTREFLTPIADLDLARVTEAEARAFNLWRDGYQRNWSNYFDPVAARLDVEEKRIAGDVTVMPLIAGTEYAEFLDLVRGAKIAPAAGDPHEATMLHWILAIDAKALVARQQKDPLLGMFATAPLSWVGQSVSLYVEQDPLWDEARKAPKPEEFLEQNLHRLPVALHVEVKDAVQCALFLAAVRGLVTSTAPGMVEWETRKHGEREYVRVGPSAQVRAQGGPMGDFALFYATLPDALILTPNEALLHRALDRRASPAKEDGGAGGPKEAAPPPPPWLGDHLCLAADRSVIDLLDRLAGPDLGLRGTMRRASWSNLWILNEWKRLFPDRDPVEVHERVFGVRIVCPGGGTYVWNDAWQTMESTAYGHPGEPKDGPASAFPFAGWRSGRFGLTFEKDGLRAKCELRKE